MSANSRAKLSRGPGSFNRWRPGRLQNRADRHRAIAQQIGSREREGERKTEMKGPCLKHPKLSYIGRALFGPDQWPDKALGMRSRLVRQLIPNACGFAALGGARERAEKDGKAEAEEEEATGFCGRGSGLISALWSSTPGSELECRRSSLHATSAPPTRWPSKEGKKE